MKKLLSLTLALAMTLSLAMPVVAEGLPEDTAAQQEVVQEVADDAPVETPEPTKPTEPTEPAEPTEQPTEAPTAEPVETPTETPAETAEPVETPTEELPTENGNANQYNDSVYDNMGMKWYYTIDVNQTCTISHADKNIEGDIVIPSEIAGCPVTQIAAYAFYNCAKLTGVTIPDTVTVIGDYAFDNCENLQTVVLSKNLESIGALGFGYCTNLASIELPDTLTSLGERAFAQTALQQVEIPANLTNSDGLAFAWCYQLTNVTFKAGATEVFKSMFLYCKNLADVTLPDTIQRIDDSAFTSTKIQNIDFPEDLNFIGNWAFQKCSELGNVEIPEKVSSIGSYAFSETNIEKIVIPKSVTSLGDRAFDECKNLTDVTLACESISDRAFYSCSKLKTVTLQTGVKSIGEEAFAFCSVLDSIIIPHGVKEVGDYAFEACSMLQTAKIPGTVKQIGVRAFYGCAKLANVTIDNGVQEIGAYAFSGCSILDSVLIPDSVKTIGESAFAECQALTNVTLPQELVVINDRTFYHCLNLSKIKIPSSVTRIGKYAFYYTRKLVSIKLPALETLEESVFSWSGLQNITIPAGVTTIENNAFQACRLKTITLPLSLKKIYSFRLLAKDIYYAGSKADKSKIEITGSDTSDSATWHYNSIGPDRTQKPSAGVKEPVVGTVTAEKGKVSILVRDEEGQPIKGAELTQPGVDASIRRTDEKGMASLPYNYGERFYAVASATGYYNAAVKVDNIIDGEMRAITMKKFDANSYVCTSVVITDPVAGTDNTYDVLTPGNPVVIFADDNSPESRTIIPEFQVADGAEPIAKVVLYQGTEKIGWSKSDWKIETKFKQYCEPGIPLYLVAYDEYDMELLRVPLQISVQPYNVIFPELSFGDSNLSFKVSENIPVFGNKTVNINTNLKLPVELKVLEGGKKVRLYVNCNAIDGLDDLKSEAEGDVSKLLKKGVDKGLEKLGKEKWQDLFGCSFGITACGFGEATFSPNSDAMVFNVRILVGISVNGTVTYYWVPSLVYIEGGLNGSATGSFAVKALKYTRQTGWSFPFAPSGYIDLNVGGSLAGGVGAKKGLLKVYAEGAGKANLDVFWALPDNNWTVDATIRADFNCVIGDYATQIKMFENTFPIYDSSWDKTTATNSSAWTDEAAKMYDASAYTMLARNYVINASTQTGTAELAQAGVYPYTTPRLVEYKGKDYLFYLDDATERGDADRTVLCYRVETSTRWSDPVRVQDDGTGDHDYALMTTADGIYVVWQNTKKVFGSDIDDLQTWQKAVGLTVAKASENGIEVIGNLNTSNEIQPNMLSLAVDNGDVVAAWVENDQNALDGKGNNTIYTQKLNGESAVCATIDKPIVYMQAGNLNGKFTIAWVEDTDSDFTTVSDCDIFLYQDGTITRVTNNEVNDGNPQFLQIDGGKLIWYSDKSIVQLDDVGAEPKAILEQSNQCAENYHVSASNGRAVLTTVNSFTLSDANTSTLYTSVFDGANWSTPTLSLMTDSSLGSMDVLCDSNGNPKLAYTLTEGNQTDLYAGAPKNPGIVQIGQIDTKMSDYMPNQAMPIKVTLVNKGNGTGNVTARFVNADGTSVWQQDLGTIGADASKEFALENVILPAGDYTLEVCTDNVVTAKSEISLGKTDLSLGTNEYYSNGEKLLDIVAKNNSNIPAEATLKITEVGNPDNVLFEDSIGTLGAKESKPYIVNLTKMFADAGDIYGLEVSVSTEQEETTLENNMQTFYNVDKIDDIPSVTLNKTNLSMYPNKVVQLTAETSGVADEIQWSSNNEACATVDNTGKVTAIAPGNATVTCTYGTATAQCYITVKDATGVITSGSYTIDEDAGTLTGFAPGTTPAQIRATLNDQSVTFKKVNGEEAPEDKPIGTGCTVTNGNQTLTLLLYGDVNGDGSITMLDMVAVRKHIMKVKLLEGIYLRAAAPSKPEAENPNPSMLDMVRVRKYIMHVSDSVL